MRLNAAVTFFFFFCFSLFWKKSLCPPPPPPTFRCRATPLIMRYVSVHIAIEYYFIIPSQQSWRGYIISPRNRVGGDIVTRPFVGGWASEWVCGFVRARVREWVGPVRHALPCGHDSDYSFCPITFKLHMHICHDERRDPIDFG